MTYQQVKTRSAEVIAELNEIRTALQLLKVTERSAGVPVRQREDVQ
jgi:hypothetical protein